MADSPRGSILLRPKFLLLCIYIIGFWALRSSDEIVSQTGIVNAGGTPTNMYVVGASPGIPRWRRQVYRVAFSPLMVAEEEVHTLIDKGLGATRQIRQSVGNALE